MDFKAVYLWASLLCVCNAVPVFQPQIGIVASNSNEILHLGGVTLTGVSLGQPQGATFVNPFVQPNVIMPPQVLNFNPQAPSPFLPPQATPGLLPRQGNQLSPFLYPPSQQELPAGPMDPSIPPAPDSGLSTALAPFGITAPTSGITAPAEVFPQYYPSGPFPQGSGGQGYPYYMSYGYPQRNTPGVVQPNLNNAQQNIEKTTQKPQQPIQNQGKGGDVLKGPLPDNRGDMAGPVIEEGYPSFSFLP